VDGNVGEMSTFERTWSETSGRQSSFEYVARLIEKQFEPDGPAVASERVRTQSQMKKNVEQLLQTRVESFQLVAVQPEISQREVETDDWLGADVSQRAVVQVEPCGRQTGKRVGQDADVAVAVNKEMLEREAFESARLDRSDPVVAQVQPPQVRQVRESADFDALETTLAEVEVFENAVRWHVGSGHRRPAEEVSVEIQLQSIERNSVRNGCQSPTWAVDNMTGWVTEAGSRTLRRCRRWTVFTLAYASSMSCQCLSHVG